jgi:hypothetical protein
LGGGASGAANFHEAVKLTLIRSALGSGAAGNAAQ